MAINWFPDLHSSEPFDERRPGLDHLAFACSSRSELEAWERRLIELDVPNGGVVDASYGSVCRFTTRTNPSMEFFASLGSASHSGESVIRSLSPPRTADPT